MPMTPQQFRLALKRLGLTQVAAARQLGVDPRTVRKWVGAERRIPEPVAILLRVWLKERRARGR
jgi:plasmid maintenance system antidote protein VapI